MIEGTVMGNVRLKRRCKYKFWAYDNDREGFFNSLDLYVIAETETEALNKAKDIVKREVYELIQAEELENYGF